MVWPVLREAANATGAPLYEYGRHWQTRRLANAMVYADSHGEAALALPSLAGAHQIVNAGNAIAALSAMEGFEVNPRHIAQGLQQAQWKGRLQRVPSALIPEGSELWFDGGHNMAAAQAIGLHVREHWQDRPFYLIFGTTQGKSITDMLTSFDGLAQRVYGVKVKTEPKSHTPQAIAEAVMELMWVQPAEGIAEALSDIAQKETQPFRALIFGSLYLWLETTLLSAAAA